MVTEDALSSTEQAACLVPGSGGDSQAESTELSLGRSISDTAGKKVGVNLKPGNISNPKCVDQQVIKQASIRRNPTRPAVHLCSSRSFSSPHSSSPSAAPLMRSSSLNRLDKRVSGDVKDSDRVMPRSQIETRPGSERTALDSGPLSSPEDSLRDNRELCDGDNAEKMERRIFSIPQASSSSGVSSAACHHHCNKVKTQTRDGVFTLCAMTSGLRHNWVQAVLKNVKPTSKPNVNVTSSYSEQRIRLTPQGPDMQSAEAVGNAAHPNSYVQESCIEERNQTCDCAEDSQDQQADQETKVQPERDQASADGSPKSSPVSSSHVSSAVSSCIVQSLIDPTQEEEHVGGDASSYQCSLLAGNTKTGVTDASSCVEGARGDSCTSAGIPLNDKSSDEHSNIGAEIEQTWHQTETPSSMEKKQASTNATFECTKGNEKLDCQQKTGQCVKELEQTQFVSQPQQLQRNLQDELQQEREHHLWQGVCPQNGLSTCNSSSEQAVALQHLQETDCDLRFEPEAQRRSQEEAREAELLRRVDLLVQQAQLLVTGDATALVQAHLKHDRRRFHEQQAEWERCVSSLMSQLSLSEQHRKEAESRLMQLQQESQSYKDVQQESESLRKQLQEVTAQLNANEDAQAQKEARLQKHLLLLQASQERERRSLAGRLAQAEQYSQDLQERLERAEEQVDSLNKSQILSREIEEAQQQLQEELARTMSAVRRLQEEREEFNRRCQELQNQLSEADGEVSRLQNRLKTEETHYYNLEHSYEQVYEELQLVLGKVQHRETETQNMREGYERLLDSKEQELSEVLLKMEVLGNSLEETEMKLNEVLKACTCASSQMEHNERQQTIEPMVTYSSQSSESPNATDVQVNSNHSHTEDVRTLSCSTDSSYQHIAAAGDDPERFMSVIRLLETKLYVTEEKLRDITQRLEEHRSHINCQDPQLCSQLTQSRATAQHLSLLLHSQAKQSRRFAQDTEKRSRVVVDRFRIALKIIRACTERLQARQTNTAAGISEIEMQLASAAACLQQGEKHAEEQQHESLNASKEENKIINEETFGGDEINKLVKTLQSEDGVQSVGRTLMNELFVVEKMVSVLQSQHGQLHSDSGVRDGDVAHRYKSIISQRISLKMEKVRAQCANAESLEKAIERICADSELIYVALKCQQQYEGEGVNMLPLKGPAMRYDDTSVHRKRLADISTPELAPYEEQVQDEGRGFEKAAKPRERDQSDAETTEVEKEPGWLENLVSRLQRRAKFLCDICQEIPDCNGEDNWRSESAGDLNWVQEQAKLIYLSERLCLHLEHELQQSKILHNKLQAKCEKQDRTLNDERDGLNQTLHQLQEDNSVLGEELECAKQKIISVETENQQLREHIHTIEDYREDRMEQLEKEFRAKISELQEIHEEEMKRLHGHYSKCSCICEEKHTNSCTEASSPDQTLNSGPPENELIMERPNNQARVSPLSATPGQITELETRTKEELRDATVGGDAVVTNETYQKDPEKVKASCDQELSAVEEKHRKLVSDLQQQHRREVAALQKEKNRLLQEEMAATRAAIVAIRRFHKEEQEKSRRSQNVRERCDITQLHTEYEKEMRLLQKELEVLSVQHTQKCLENSQLSHELQDERRVLTRCQKENQELKTKQRETGEISQQRSSLHGNQSHVASQDNNLYELEVILRAKEIEMQFLRQEALSLQEELRIARMDKVYAQNKLKALHASRPGEPQREVTNICEDFEYASWCPSRDCPTPDQGYEAAAINKSDSVFLKKPEKVTTSRPIRGVRSKSLKEGLTVQERMKLFDSF